MANAVSRHDCSAVKGMQRYMDFMCQGWTDGLHDFWEEGFPQVKPMFARLINAKPGEIAFTGSTTIGENTLVNGMDLRGVVKLQLREHKQPFRWHEGH